MKTQFVSLDDLERDEAPPIVPRQAARNIRFKAFKDIQISTAARYIVKGIVPSSGLVVVWGEPKCGKSFFVFDMVAHVAAGWEYRGHRVQQCPAVYFALEGAEGFSARVEAFREHHKVSDIPFYLSADRILLPQNGADVVLSIKREFPNVRPGIVVLDTLNRSISGSENAPEDMGAYVRAADMIREAFDCTVIIIHHCGTNGERPRGHTSLTGAADAQLHVKRDAENNVVATVEFMKDGPEGAELIGALEQIVVGVDQDGDDISSCIVRPVDRAEKSGSKSPVKGQAALALRTLHDAILEHGEFAPANNHVPANTRTIREDLWRSHFYAGTASDDTTKGARQKAFVRAVTTLQTQNYVGKWGELVWLT